MFTEYDCDETATKLKRDWQVWIHLKDLLTSFLANTHLHWARTYFPLSNLIQNRTLKILTFIESNLFINILKTKHTIFFNRFIANEIQNKCKINFIYAKKSWKLMSWVNISFIIIVQQITLKMHYGVGWKLHYRCNLNTTLYIKYQGKFLLSLSI